MKISPQSATHAFNPIEGQLVDAGGRKMHIHGTGNGSPTVILDSGLGDS